jgi:hypothetical protein
MIAEVDVPSAIRRKIGICIILCSPNASVQRRGNIIALGPSPACSRKPHRVRCNAWLDFSKLSRSFNVTTWENEGAQSPDHTYHCKLGLLIKRMGAEIPVSFHGRDDQVKTALHLQEASQRKMQIAPHLLPGGLYVRRHASKAFNKKKANASVQRRD